MPIICAENLFKHYNKKIIINSINFNLDEKKTIVFLGEDNSGKTTLTKLLAKIIKPTSGTVEANDTISFMPSEDGVSEHLTVYENLYTMALLCDYKSKEAKELINKYANKYGLAERFDDKVKTLSTSLKKLLSFVLALIQESSILIMDEPFKNVDIKTHKLLLEAIKELKNEKTIIITTELPTVAKELADDLLILKNGKIRKIDKEISIDEIEQEFLNVEVE